jgi:uncharacterized protein (TIGR00369 family)
MSAAAVPPGWTVLAGTLQGEGGFGAVNGPFWERARPGEDGGGVDIAFLVGEQHLNSNGIVHGGMLMTFVDQAIGATVWRSIDRKPCATITLNCNFLAPAKLGDWLEARAEITRRGRSVVFAGGRIRCEDRILLTAEGVWKILGTT